MNRNFVVFMLMFFSCIWSADSQAEKADKLMVERAQKAKQLLLQSYQDKGPGVAYLIAHKGKTLISGGFGMADMESMAPMSANTISRLGSISKSITAVAVLTLVEQGKLDLDVPISNYAASLPEHMGKVTLRQLLSHRSGIAEHAFDESLIPFVWQPMTTDKIIELQAAKPADFDPGEKYQYVNFNYVLVAHVIEKILNRPFVEFINEQFKQWGMNQSFYDENSAVIPGRAEFYDKRDDKIINAADVDMSHVSAAGALLSSPQDMAIWMSSLLKGDLISEASLALAWSPVPLADGASTEYGLGFNNTQFHGERLIWHTGLTPGAQAVFEYTTDSQVLIALLSNGFHLPNSGRLADDLMEIMIGKDTQ